MQLDCLVGKYFCLVLIIAIILLNFDFGNFNKKDKLVPLGTRSGSISGLASVLDRHLDNVCGFELTFAQSKNKVF